MRNKIKHNLIFGVLILIFTLIVCGFVKDDQISFMQEISQPEARVVDEAWLEQQTEERLASMTVEEKVYQMFIVTPEALTEGAAVTAIDETARDFLKECPVGGLVYFSKNLTDTEQTKELLRRTQAYALELQGLPLFQCVDEEGGRVARIGNNKAFHVPKVGPMGKLHTKEEAYAAGSTVGAYLRDLGFNLDFAPDADVLTNPQNTVIGNRSFGGDAGLVLRYASAYSDGLHAYGILSTFKHFPGHGATEADTHDGFAYTERTYEELRQADLVPFAGAEEAGIDFVMVSHIAVPNVTGDNMPCSLSYQMITQVLRGALKYDGIIVTDAMNMGAITELYASDEAAVTAIKAGVDVILMPEDFRLAAQGVLAAVRSGVISEERIDESVRRLIMAKLKM